MQINKMNNISFRENRLTREMNSQDAILMLRDPKASVKFQQSQEYGGRWMRRYQWRDKTDSWGTSGYRIRGQRENPLPAQMNN